MRSALGLAAAVASIWVATAATPPSAAAARPLDTGILASKIFYGSDAAVAFGRTLDAGATTVRVQVSWREVAPTPPTIDATNPADPSYRWAGLDPIIRAAVASGLRPFVTIAEAPAWAERGSGGRAGTNNPDPVQFGHFARALAVRYSGAFGGLPRVAAFEVWNEVNASFFFFPQRENGEAVSPSLYRRMVNEVAGAVHAVHRDNLVVAGGLFPFVVDRATAQSIGPLRFMRNLLCMSKRLRPLRNCGEPVQFDVWSHHPYTSGGPTHRAGHPDSVSIHELPRMRRLLAAAVRLGHVVHSGRVGFWVTEFSWDSRPPDPGGVPSRLHARWVAEGLYRMWRAGVSLVTWFQLRDEATDGRPNDQVFQSGLYRHCSAGVGCDRPKLALAAFRFPFVAFRSGRSVSVWGRTPAGRRARVLVDQRVGRGWKRLASVRTRRYGIFSRRLRTSRRGRLRARLRGGPVAVPFSLVRPRDRQVNPFG